MLREALDQHGKALQLQAEAKTRFAETGDDGEKTAVEDAKNAIARAKAYLNHARSSRNAAYIKHMIELSNPPLCSRRTGSTRIPLI